MWTLTSASKKFSERHLPNDALLWTGVVCFIISTIVAIEIGVHITYMFGLWLSVLISILSFYILFQLMVAVALFIIDKFVGLYRK